MTKKIAALILITAVLGFAVAEEDPVPRLKEGDVEHFIQTYPALSQDLDELGMEYEAESGAYDMPEAVRRNEAFNAVLKKHGWDEHFYVVIGTVLQGYTALAYGEEVPEINQKLADAVKEIESNPALSEAMKEQLIAQMKAAGGMVAGQQAAMQESVHPDDLEQIRGHMDELKDLLEEND